MVTHGSRSLAPRIGVSWINPLEVATHRLLAAVRAAGGEPVPLLAEAASWTADTTTLQGLVLSGGNAVDPRRYGEENRGLCRVVIPHRDELEADALHFCVERVRQAIYYATDKKPIVEKIMLGLTPEPRPMFRPSPGPTIPRSRGTTNTILRRPRRCWRRPAGRWVR